MTNKSEEKKIKRERWSLNDRHTCLGIKLKQIKYNVLRFDKVWNVHRLEEILPNYMHKKIII